MFGANVTGSGDYLNRKESCCVIRCQSHGNLMVVFNLKQWPCKRMLYQPKIDYNSFQDKWPCKFIWYHPKIKYGSFRDK